MSVWDKLPPGVVNPQMFVYWMLGVAENHGRCVTYVDPKNWKKLDNFWLRTPSALHCLYAAEYSTWERHEHIEDGTNSFKGWLLDFEKTHIKFVVIDGSIFVEFGERAQQRLPVPIEHFARVIKDDFEQTHSVHLVNAISDSAIENREQAAEHKPMYSMDDPQPQYPDISPDDDPIPDFENAGVSKLAKESTWYQDDDDDEQPRHFDDDDFSPLFPEAHERLQQEKQDEIMDSMREKIMSKLKSRTSDDDT